MVGINSAMLGTEVAPFGGVKESGLGREGAIEGMEEYLSVKYISYGGLGAI
jgi:succinate-semialdehyde dehydrogenase/glutarate-semialdehyde dehydrogenase